MAVSNTGKYRLLSIDDDKANAELIVRTALKCGYEAFPVYNARTAREAVSHWRPHVITIDLGLPDSEGFELFSGFQSLDFRGEVVIISGQEELFRQRAARFAALSGLNIGTLPSFAIC
jgi:DNA-binding response OmpR family regulator